MPDDSTYHKRGGIIRRLVKTAVKKGRVYTYGLIRKITLMVHTESSFK